MVFGMKHLNHDLFHALRGQLPLADFVLWIVVGCFKHWDSNIILLELVDTYHGAQEGDDLIGAL